MALIKCPECGRENVSDSADACPDCGYGIKAHFEAIKKQKILEQQQIEQEKRRQEAERLRKEEEQAELDTIKMPGKPNILINILTVGIIFLPIILFGIIVKLPIWTLFFLVCYIAGIISAYRDDMKDYNSAVNNFEAYQREKLNQKKSEEYRAAMRRANAPKCPICNSVNIRRISTASRASSVALVGMASGKIGKQYQCGSCGHMW